MGVKISGPVGKGAVSNFTDAVTVQVLLNSHIGFNPNLFKWVKPLVTDGKVDGKNPADPTVTAIIIFQREIVGFTKPDGRVDPGGKTFKALTGPIGAPVKPPSPSGGTSTPGTQTSDPVPLKQGINRIRFGGSQVVKTGLGSFDVTAGKLYKAIDGDRLVTAIIAGEVVYALMRSTSSGVKTGVYSQVMTGFVSDVTIGAAASHIVSSTRAIHTAMLIEMHLLCGIAIGISFPAAVFSFGSGVGAWIAENERNFSTWRRGGAGLIVARTTIKRCAPTLYNELFVLAMKNLAANIPAAIASDEKLIAATIGEWIGRLGKGGFHAAFSIAGKVVAILWPALKAVVKSLPGAGAKTQQQIADELVAAFRSGGRTLTPATAAKIRDEVMANKSELFETFQKLEKAFSD